MRKLPAKTARILLPLILTFLMTFIVSGVSTWLAIGDRPGWTIAWARAWLTSWAIAFPSMLLVLPLAQRLVACVIETPRQTPANRAAASP